LKRVKFEIPDNYTVGSPQYEWGINPNYNYANVAYTYYYRMKKVTQQLECVVIVVLSIALIYARKNAGAKNVLHVPDIMTAMHEIMRNFKIELTLKNLKKL